jgi:Family of unknown function (DUF6056)
MGEPLGEPMDEPPAEPRSHRAGAAVLILALLLALSALAWRGWSTRYVSDDYCTAAGLQEDGYLGNILAHRQEWSGRFSYYAFKGALEAIGPVTARVVPGLMLALTACAAAWASRSWLVGLAIAFAGVDSAPEAFSMYGAFVWETGAVTYMLPIALLLTWIGLFARSASAIAGFVLLFIAGGLSETTLAVQGAMAGVALLFVLRDGQRRRIAIAGLAATLLALTIIATAPGNEVRSKIQPFRESLLDASVAALRHAYDFVGVHLFLEGAALIVILAAGALIGRRFSRAAWARAAAIALLCYVVSFVPSAWAISASPPPRALYVANFCIVAAVFVAGGALGQTFRPRGLALGVLALLPLWSAYSTMRTIPEAARGAAHVDAIERLLHERRGQDVVLQSPWALSSHWAGPDPTHSSNRCISRYFGLKSLQVVR